MKKFYNLGPVLIKIHFVVSYQSGDFRPEVIKLFFMLNSTETFPDHKC